MQISSLQPLSAPSSSSAAENFEIQVATYNRFLAYEYDFKRFYFYSEITDDSVLLSITKKGYFALA